MPATCTRPPPQAAPGAPPGGRARRPIGALGGAGLGLLLLGLTAPAPAPGDDQAGARQRFLQAEQALRDSDPARYRRLLGGLRDYPLLPYLRYAQLRGQLESTSGSEVQDFLARYPDTPIAETLRRAWIRSRHARGDWAAVVAAYAPADGDEETRCRYLWALHGLGDRAAALAGAEAVWWSRGPLSAPCAPLIDAWHASGALSPELAWTRLERAMDADDTDLARELGRFLDGPGRRLAETWLGLRAEPGRLTELAGLAGDTPITRRIAVDTLVRRARRDPLGTADAWRAAAARHTFSPTESAAVNAAIGRGLERSDDAAALAWLERIPEALADSRVKEGAALSALRLGRWSEALGWIERLPRAESSSERWRYWRARALAEDGQQVAAEALLTALAEERSLYGFLAADHLGRPYALNHRPVAATLAALAEVEAAGGVQRARELQALGRATESRREWAYTLRDRPGPELTAAAVLAERWGWHDRAIAALARAGELGDLVVRFPLAFLEPVLDAARGSRIDPAWVYGVLRQESGFWVEARSPAGALGLMQLLPGTAREAARSLQLRLPSDRAVLEPDTNIRLGAAHLRRVLDGLDGHPVLATAAYNAGIQRVRGWVPQGTAQPADLWVESVPFAETRRYLQQVLTYTTIYRQRLGLPPVRLAERMRPVGRDPSSRTASSERPG
jgi:soluble lytic murein transglycosylase